MLNALSHPVDYRSAVFSMGCHLRHFELRWQSGPAGTPLMPDLKGPTEIIKARMKRGVKPSRVTEPVDAIVIDELVDIYACLFYLISNYIDPGAPAGTRLVPAGVPVPVPCSPGWVWVGARMDQDLRV
jgi:hypothetical protein